MEGGEEMNAITLRVRIVVLVIAALMAAMTGAIVTAATVADDAPPAGEIMMVDEIRVVGKSWPEYYS